MRIAALLVAVFILAIGVFGIVLPGSLTAVRRQVFDAPNALCAASALRATMGRSTSTSLALNHIGTPSPGPAIRVAVTAQQKPKKGRRPDRGRQNAGDIGTPTKKPRNLQFATHSAAL